MHILNAISVGVLTMELALCGCSHPKSASPTSLSSTRGSGSTLPQPQTPMVPAPYPPYTPFMQGRMTKSFIAPIATMSDGSKLYELDPRDYPQNIGRTITEPNGRQIQGVSVTDFAPNTNEPAPVMQGHVLLRNMNVQIKDGGPNATLLEGSIQVFNEGPYAVTDLQICLRINGQLYVVVPSGESLGENIPKKNTLPIPPGTASPQTVRATIPSNIDTKQGG